MLALVSNSIVSGSEHEERLLIHFLEYQNAVNSRFELFKKQDTKILVVFRLLSYIRVFFSSRFFQQPFFKVRSETLKSEEYPNLRNKIFH